jgi:hypothetical protein
LPEFHLLLVFFFYDRSSTYFVLVLLNVIKLSLIYVLASEGLEYMNTQKPIQINPRPPITMKAISQPHALASKGIVNGATRAPIEAPALKIEVAYARSFLGKY